MKNYRMIFSLLVVLLATTAFSITKPDADALYEKEKYEEAAKAYEAMLKEQGVSCDVLYNLGNCYYKLDDIPHAILNYERALMLSPGADDIRANLALARGKTTDKVVPPSEMFFVTWWRNVVNSMSIDSWCMMGIATFILMLIGVLVYLFISTLLFRKIGIYGAMAMLVVCIIANLAALSQHLDFRSHRAAIVMSPSVTVKSSPSYTGTDLFVIHEGAKVEILDDTMTDWMEVKFEEGKQGWMQTADAEKI